MSQALSAAAFDTFATLLKSRSGLVIGTDKLYLLETRLAPILKREKLRDLAALAERLRLPGRDAVARDVVEAMTTNESFFFRDDKPFQHFRTQALPRLHAARPANALLRVWSAASSSGQEAYSIAMIIAECRAIIANRRIEIVGTDLARDQLARARDGLYTQFEVQRGLPWRRSMRHFRKEEAGWRISEAIRAMVQDREWICSAICVALGQFDVVFAGTADPFRTRRPRRACSTLSRSRPALPRLLTRRRRDRAGHHQPLSAPLAERARSLRVGCGIRRGATRICRTHRQGSTRGARAVQCIPPRAAIGHRHSTRPLRTPTYQS